MKIHDMVEKANQPQVSVPTTVTAATVGMLTASEWLTLLSICVVVMQLIIALPKFLATLRSFAGWLRQKFGGKGGQSGKSVRAVAIAMMSVGGLATLLSVAAPIIKGHEGKTNHAIIPVPGDVPTICHGHTATAEMGQVKTDAECEALLRQDLSKAIMVVALHVDVTMPIERWVALASFVFNVGEGNFARSTLLKKLNAGDTVGACNELRRWVYAGGRKLKGLERRREAERALCLQGAG